MRMVHKPSSSSSSSSSSSHPVPHQPKQHRFKGARYRSWGRWVSEIRLPKSRERVWLGSFATAEMASRAFKAASLVLHDPSVLLGGHASGLQFSSRMTPAQRRLFKDKIRSIVAAPGKPSQRSANLAPNYQRPYPHTIIPSYALQIIDDNSKTAASLWEYDRAVIDSNPDSDSGFSPNSDSNLNSDSDSIPDSDSNPESPLQYWAGLESDGAWRLGQEMLVLSPQGNLWEADLQILRELESDLASNSI